MIPFHPTWSPRREQSGSCSILKTVEQTSSDFKCWINKHRTALSQKYGWKNELFRELQYRFMEEGKIEAKRVTCPRLHIFLSEPEMKLKSP